MIHTQQRPLKDSAIAEAGHNINAAEQQILPARLSLDHCLHQLFQTQAKRSPDVLAVATPISGQAGGSDQWLTYRELNARANQLAHFLRCSGVAPGVLVGICVERSIELVIGM